MHPLFWSFFFIPSIKPPKWHFQKWQKKKSPSGKGVFTPPIPIHQTPHFLIYFFKNIYLLHPFYWHSFRKTVPTKKNLTKPETLEPDHCPQITECCCHFFKVSNNIRWFVKSDEIGGFRDLGENEKIVEGCEVMTKSFWWWEKEMGRRKKRWEWGKRNERWWRRDEMKGEERKKICIGKLGMWKSFSRRRRHENLEGLEIFLKKKFVWDWR